MSVYISKEFPLFVFRCFPLWGVYFMKMTFTPLLIGGKSSIIFPTSGVTIIVWLHTSLLDHHSSYICNCHVSLSSLVFPPCFCDAHDVDVTFLHHPYYLFLLSSHCSHVQYSNSQHCFIKYLRTTVAAIPHSVIGAKTSSVISTPMLHLNSGTIAKCWTKN